MVLDTDFIGGITSYRAGNEKDLFRRVFQALGREPVVHEFVAERELMHNAAAQQLIAEETLKVITAEEILRSWPAPYEDALLLYRFSFDDLYQIIKGRPLDPDIDIYESHSGMSFGELHSILLATTLQIPLFYSNDGGSKAAAYHYAEGRLLVKNAVEVSEDLRGRDGVSGDERRFIRHVYTR